MSGTQSPVRKALRMGGFSPKPFATERRSSIQGWSLQRSYIHHCLLILRTSKRLSEIWKPTYTLQFPVPGLTLYPETETEAPASARDGLFLPPFVRLAHRLVVEG